MKPNFGISSAQVNELLYKQLATWPLAAANYKALEVMKTTDLFSKDLSIKIQYNPAPNICSNNLTYNRSLPQQTCFLCADNLPVQQERLPFGNESIVLCNPYPLFPSHFTIASRMHTPQRILAHFKTMLVLSRKLDKYTLLYNGPTCGASAPGHFHFQAGTKGIMPWDSEVDSLINTYGEPILQETSDSLYAIKGIARNCFILKAKSTISAKKLFGLVYQALPENAGEPEPMMNILCNYENGTWTVTIFPRIKSIPGQYESASDQPLILNPGASNMGGLFNFTSKEDFDKITSETVTEIYKQICISEESLQAICDKIIKLVSK